MVKALEEVLVEQGIVVEDSSGGRKVATCPFHEGDHEASFTIYPNHTYFCFGCQEWGDGVKFLVDFKHWTFNQAVEYVGADYKMRSADKPQVIKIKNAVATWEFLYDISEQYHQFLLETPGALNYLYKRGLTLETITKFKVGYSDGAVLKLNWAWEHELALETGIINKNGFEMMSHRITIPNLTEDTYADFLIGRTITNDKIKYLGARVPKPLHGFYAIRQSPVIFLAEGQFDWLSLRQWGFPAAVVGGTHLSRHNLQLLADRKVVIVPDLDESGIGMAAAQKIAAQLGEAATILDYSELKTSEGKLDVSALAEFPGGEALFKQIVMEQIPWITLLSRRTQAKWFPTLQINKSSDSISRLQV